MYLLPMAIKIAFNPIPHNMNSTIVVPKSKVSVNGTTFSHGKMDLDVYIQEDSLLDNIIDNFGTPTIIFTIKNYDIPMKMMKTS